MYLMQHKYAVLLKPMAVYIKALGLLIYTLTEISFSPAKTLVMF